MHTFTITFSDGSNYQTEAPCYLHAAIAATAWQLSHYGETLITHIVGSNGFRMQRDTYLWLARVPLPLRVRLMDAVIVWLFYGGLAVLSWYLVGLVL